MSLAATDTRRRGLNTERDMVKPRSPPKIVMMITLTIKVVWMVARVDVTWVSGNASK